MSTLTPKKTVQDSPFKKSASEKALLKVAIKTFTNNKRKLNPAFDFNKGLGLSTNNIKDLAELLKLADTLEIALIDKVAA